MLAAQALKAATAAVFGLSFSVPCAATEREGIFLIGDGSERIYLTDRDVGNASLIVASHRPAPGVGSQGRRAIVVADSFARQRGALADIVSAAARSQALDPALLHAVIGVESGYALRAVSPRGALGLMQLMPATAKEYGVTDPFDPLQNIAAGARHLRMLLNQFGQNTSLALAAYNAGSSAVWRHRQRVPPFAETTAYVSKVLGSYAALQRQFETP